MLDAQHAIDLPVEVGQRIRLDLGAVDAKTFEDHRIAYHRTQQDSFFREHVITGVTDHVIRSGESIWVLALRDYDVPVWLFRQYNPGLDLHSVRIFGLAGKLLLDLVAVVLVVLSVSGLMLARLRARNGNR